ncbi:DksA/TraR family C4-type zinc finger protein [Pseudidiomarina mangrovi]|uniref:DksA/TraR family C4-type zinc finger protein n=1 Tax=Pseudidiomarina mangrovi TaxID=2487133 RepID=UPI000FC99FBA|nr:DksA/TraR family C4-type zinc finger protein [Pseudidiomarina mangrovi]
MAGGWSRDGTVQEQIDASTEDSVKQATSKIPAGESLIHCAECGETIPRARREALPGVRYCIQCQTELDKQASNAAGINRRGSKDSQLR